MSAETKYDLEAKCARCGETFGAHGAVADSCPGQNIDTFAPVATPPAPAEPALQHQFSESLRDMTRLTLSRLPVSQSAAAPASSEGPTREECARAVRAMTWPRASSEGTGVGRQDDTEVAVLRRALHAATTRADSAERERDELRERWKFDAGVFAEVAHECEDLGDHLDAAHAEITALRADLERVTRAAKNLLRVLPKPRHDLAADVASAIGELAEALAAPTPASSPEL